MKKIEFFKAEGDRITRIRKYCPKCGPAVFLADHKDRFSCGNCGYTEFKGGSRPPKPPRAEQKPVEAKTEATVKEPSQEEASESMEEKPTEEVPPEQRPGDETPKEKDEKQPED